MAVEVKSELHIENLRNHPAESVKRLAHLLNSGSPLRDDPRHPNFFEIDDSDRVFYVHISPASDKVIFLATWARDPLPEPQCVAGQFA